MAAAIIGLAKDAGKGCALALCLSLFRFVFYIR